VTVAEESGGPSANNADGVLIKLFWSKMWAGWGILLSEINTAVIVQVVLVCCMNTRDFFEAWMQCQKDYKGVGDWY